MTKISLQTRIKASRLSASNGPSPEEVKSTIEKELGIKVLSIKANHSKAKQDFCYVAQVKADQFGAFSKLDEFKKVDLVVDLIDMDDGYLAGVFALDFNNSNVRDELPIGKEFGMKAPE